MTRRTTITVLATTTVLLLVTGLTAAHLLRTQGSPGDTAARFLAAWERGDLATMKNLTTTPAPTGFDAAYRTLRDDLGVTTLQAAPRPAGPTRDQTAPVPYTATLTLPTGARWRYDATLALTAHHRRWRVAWTPAAVHPGLRPGHRLTTTTAWPDRAALRAADGTRIDGTDVPGSVRQLAGTTGPASPADLKRLGPPYAAGDPVGRTGLQQAHHRRLAGVPATTVHLTTPAGQRTRPLATLPGRPGTDLTTTLDLRVQRAAGRALTRQDKPAALVALRPSTGDILAIANQPGGFDRALLGRYPPGSTFKVITTAALLADGITPRTRVQCAKTTTIGGRSFRNFEGERLGAIDFRTAFAHSCNTVFAGETTRRLDARQLAAATRDFGFDTPLTPGAPAARATFPAPRDDAEFAAASFGQGRVLATPLTMAAVAAAVQNGTWRHPRLTPGNPGRTRPLDPRVTAPLRDMMTRVVTEGTAEDARLPARTAGKTGTAEYGTGAEPPTHAWFIGYRGDLAFAVLVEDGGTGGGTAAPLAAAFLRAL